MNNEELSNAIQKWQKKDPENRAVFSILMDKKGYTTRSVMGAGKDILASLCATIHQNPQLGVLMRMAIELVNKNKQKYEDSNEQQ